MKRTTIVIMIIVLFSKITGLARDVILSYYYGTTNISDAYIISLSIPMILFATISTALATNFIPVYSNIESNDGRNKADKFTNDLINWIIVISSIFVMLGNLFAEQLITVFAPGFDGATKDLASDFLKVTFITLIFIGITNVLSSYLEYKKFFIASTISILPLNFILIISIYFSDSLSLFYLPYGILFAYLSQLIILIIYVKKNNFLFYLKLNKKDENLKKMITLSIPLIIGVSVNQINTLIDRALASNVIEGGISALNYADRVNVLLQGVVISSVIIVYYPNLVRLVQNVNINEVSRVLKMTMFRMNILLIPATFGTMFFNKEIIGFLYGRGAFDESSILLTSNALFFYILGIVFFGMREVIVRYFYAIGNTRTPMTNSIIGMILNIILNLILVKILGLPGLALATSLSSFIIFILLLIDLNKLISIDFRKNEYFSYLKIIGASIVISYSGKIIYNFIINYISIEISFIISFIFCFISYVGLLLLLKIEDVHFIHKKFQNTKK